MTRTPRLTAGIAAAAVALGAWASAARTQPPTPGPAPAAPAAGGFRVAPAKVVGATSCAAASCHGETAPHGTPGGESTTFTDADPHRTAYSVLFQDRSKRMVRLLAEGKDHAPAHRTDLCLKCHGAAPPNPDAAIPADSELHASAACENCHGAAGSWVADHYTRDWKALDSRAKADRGLVPTKDFSARATVCAGCHVGEPGREVDHRLIAAGHPALRFELSAYSTPPVYAKHWKAEKGYGRDAEAWMWAIGRVAAAKASATLLEHRATEAAAEKRDWPEFAEYSCFACHRGVIGDASNPPVAGRKSGALPWGTWAFPQVLDLAEKSGPSWATPAAKADGLAKLSALYEKTDRPAATDVRAAAAAARADLVRWLTELQTRASARSATDPLSPAELRDALKVTLKSKPGFDWDASTQRFLGTAALYRGLCAADPAARSEVAEKQLRAIATGLRFPAGQDGPKLAPIPPAAWDDLLKLLR